MQFIDEAKIHLTSGNGGAGCLSFRREAHVPRGGPDGGNGGRGGDVIFHAIAGLNTLIDFRYAQHFKAQNGERGKGRQKNGSYGDDCIIDVPVGTQIFLEDEETLLADLTEVGQRITLAKGGDGGLGNAHFKSSVNRAPRRTTPGYPGTQFWVMLKLKLLSDVGLVGLPNAGKSSFLRAVTRATPKVADYPFTTLEPKLGVASIDGKECLIADIPGLIEGAHEGHGLGDRFLKHIERCQRILHIVDGTQEDFLEHYVTIRRELERYSSILAAKEEIVVLNKIDALQDDVISERVQQLSEQSNTDVLPMSAISKKGTDDVLRALVHEKIEEENFFS